MCTGISNNMTVIAKPTNLETIENTTYCQRVSYDYSDYYESYEYGNNYNLKYDMQQNNFSITFNLINNGSNENINIPSNFDYPYNPLRQAYLISLKPVFICEMIENSDRRDFHKSPNCRLELNPQLEQIPVQLGPNEIQFGVYPRSNPNILRYEMTKIFGITDVISSLGGFYGGITGIYVFFFGMQKLEPCRESLMINFAREYVSSAGMPLTEKVNERPEGSSIYERVQILETLLKEFYLDDYYLEKVKRVLTAHKNIIILISMM
ncbi:hypothetical protein C1645_830347 [Glomus cerebriforme]|uniref:Uncharacterized protein n=1 Tax=Glomus cerebriforme TaxID=658196 RepID=A0A397SMB5_9GLOM|nr:hypothetical protein C1645_830347 [Glomus cerebriforme]